MESMLKGIVCVNTTASHPAPSRGKTNSLLYNVSIFILDVIYQRIFLTILVKTLFYEG